MAAKRVLEEMMSAGAIITNEDGNLEVPGMK